MLAKTGGYLVAFAVAIGFMFGAASAVAIMAVIANSAGTGISAVINSVDDFAVGFKSAQDIARQMPAAPAPAPAAPAPAAPAPAPAAPAPAPAKP